MSLIVLKLIQLLSDRDRDLKDDRDDRDRRENGANGDDRKRMLLETRPSHCLC